MKIVNCAKNLKMRKFIPILLTLVSFFAMSFSEKNELVSINDVGNDIAESIKKGDAAGLAKWFGSTVELSVLGKKGSYSKAQAELLVKDFFELYPPESFAVTSEGNSAAYSLYTIGSYESNGKKFKTYFLIRKVDEEYKLHILKFEEIK